MECKRQDGEDKQKKNKNVHQPHKRTLLESCLNPCVFVCVCVCVCLCLQGLFILGQQQQQQQLLPTQCLAVNGREVCDRKPLQDDRRGTCNGRTSPVNTYTH